jgi:predicted unusual protein kinase regulating ubiquinone biosynthesis (AarF/ABC1/UbiB family)
MGSDDRDERERQGVDALRADRKGQEGRREPPEPEEQRGKIPQTRIGRSAKLGTAIGGQATRYAGTAAANVVRSDEKAQERLETRHLETALKMASVLGEMKGAAMKIGQMASFIDVDFLPPEHREIYQE